jgi:hypothetical protein
MEHPDTLSSVNNLARVIQNLGKYEEAEKLHRRALEENEKILKMKYPSTFIRVSNLARALQY